MLTIRSGLITDSTFTILVPNNNAIPLVILNEYAVIGGICSAIAILLACHQIIMHLYFFNEPKLQLYIVRILLMVPVRIKFNRSFRFILCSHGLVL